MLLKSSSRVFACCLFLLNILTEKSSKSMQVAWDGLIGLCSYWEILNLSCYGNVHFRSVRTRRIFELQPGYGDGWEDSMSNVGSDSSLWYDWDLWWTSERGSETTADCHRNFRPWPIRSFVHIVLFSIYLVFFLACKWATNCRQPYYRLHSCILETTFRRLRSKMLRNDFGQ